MRVYSIITVEKSTVPVTYHIPIPAARLTNFFVGVYLKTIQGNLTGCYIQLL